jgi:hypothetical protein
MEEDYRMNPGYSGNMQMQYHLMDNVNPVPYPYENIASEEFGYESMVPEEPGHENLYPQPYNMTGNAGMNNYGNYPISPQYNQYGYINPDENVHSPWANNTMYGGMNNPLPMRNCPFL